MNLVGLPVWNGGRISETGDKVGVSGAEVTFEAFVWREMQERGAPSFAKVEQFYMVLQSYTRNKSIAGFL